MNQSCSLFSSSTVRRVAAIAAFSCATPFAVLAQPLSAADAPSPSTRLVGFSAQPLNFDLGTLPGVSYSDLSSSSSEANGNPVAAERLNLGTTASDASQPPPRRRYGRPRYTDRGHNADGSSKLAIMAGGGLTIPTGSSSNLLSTGYKIQGGVGVNFSKEAALLLQVDYDHFGLPGSLIRSQQALYSGLGFFSQDPTTGATIPVDFSQLAGNAHIWSITLNPTFNFYQGDSFGAYAVVGGGFYHKVTNFTLPQQQQGFNYYYGQYSYTANQTFDHYTSNSAGLNGGIGFTWKPSRFASERLYAEARFVHTFDSAAKQGPRTYDFFPANHMATNYVPITIGVRF